MIDTHKCLEIVNILESVPHDLASKMSVSELRALVRLGFVTHIQEEQSYRPIVDAVRLCRLSKGTHRLVKLTTGPDQSLEGFKLTQEGHALLNGLKKSSSNTQEAPEYAQSRLQAAVDLLESLTPA
ncbi:MAG: hypothetical protein SOH81_05925 [Acetobacter sp.]|jgi:hypothetical protein